MQLKQKGDDQNDFPSKHSLPFQKNLTSNKVILEAGVLITPKTDDSPRELKKYTPPEENVFLISVLLYKLAKAKYSTVCKSLI